MAEASRDQNRVNTLLGVSDIDQKTPIDVWTDPTTHELLVKSSISSLPLPTGAATSAKQDSQITLETTLNSLTETLQELVQRLAPLAGAMSNTAQLRTVVTGAVTATGGGYITSAQHIANTLTQTNTLRYDPNNTLAIQSNINNCVVT